MSWTHISDTECKARKPHRCMVCDSVIQPRESQVVRRGFDNDGPTSFHMHPECKQISAKWTNEDWECHSPGELSRGDVLLWMEVNP